MSQKKVIELVTELDPKGLNQLDAGLKKVDKSSKDVEVQSNKTSKSLKDVGDNGGTISTLDSLTGGLATRIRDAAEASQLFNGNLKATRAALIATGIGAFVVALGVVVAYWDEISDAIRGVNKQLRVQNETINKALDTLDFEIKLLEAKEKLLIAEGKSVEHIGEEKRKIILLQQEENTLLLDNLKTQLEREKSQTSEVTRWERIKIATLEAIGLYDQAAIARAESIVGNDEERSAIAELEQRLQDATLRSEALKLSLLELDRPVEETATTTTSTTQQLDRPRNLEAIKSQGLMELEIIENNEALKTKALEKYADERKFIALQEQEYRQALFQAEVGLAMQFGNLLRQIGEENKEIAIAGIIVEQIASAANVINSTVAANAKAVAASPLTGGQPWVAINSISAALGIASGVAASVKAINQLGGSGGASGTPNIGNAGGAQAPSFNVVGQSGVNQLADTLNQDQQPIQAFVVGSQVTTQQELDNNILNTANIG